MQFDPEKITFFAKTDSRGQAVPFGIKAKDRQRHMYVVGKTGMGKSTLLENMAVQDIQNGEGMAFIDPHGSAAEVLLDYVPEHRIDDVIYFAPFDLDNPISFNVMEDVGADKRHLVVSGLMSTFKKIWVDAWSARMEYILTNALLVLIEYPDTTLLSVNRIFTDKAYRKKVVEACTDPAVKSFWVDEFANYTDRFAAEALPAIQNKIGQFTGNPLIRNVIGQPKSSFDIRTIMDERKILIMNLSKGLIGETNANLLGSMLTTRIYLAAMSRADLPVETMKKMPNFYFYVDEFQSFANATFANILSEARKYHLNLIIAHQYIEQMEEEVRDAVFGNVGTTISFRVGPFDAETLETVFTPQFLATDLVNLGFAQIYLTLMIDGIGSQPFSAVTLPPIAPPSVSCKQMVISHSRKNFTRPRAEVEQLVTELHNPPPPPPTKASNTQTTQNKPNQKPAVSKPAAPPTNNRPGANQASPTRKSNFSGSSSNTQSPASDTPHKQKPSVDQSSRDQSKGAASPPKDDRIRSHTPPRQTNNAPAKPKSAEDLKAILARIAKDSADKNTSKKSPSSSAGNAKHPARSTAASAAANSNNVPDQQPKPESLKSALAQLTQTDKKEKSTSSPATPATQSAAPPSSRERPTSSSATSEVQSPMTPVDPAPDDTASLAAQLAAAEADWDDKTEIGVDAKKVEHILKAPKHERSPFS